MKNVFLTKNMNSFQDGSFESFSSIAEALKRASELNFTGFLFIGNLKTVNGCTVFYTDDIDGSLKSRNFSYDDFNPDNFFSMIIFINTHEIQNVRKSIAYTISEKKVFHVDFGSTLDPHNMAHL